MQSKDNAHTHTHTHTHTLTTFSNRAKLGKLIKNQYTKFLIGAKIQKKRLEMRNLIIRRANSVRPTFKANFLGSEDQREWKEKRFRVRISFGDWWW